MSSKPRFGFVVDYVTDMEAARRFYVDIMGLEVEREHPTFVQFEGFAIASDQPLGGKPEAELYWLVDDVEAAYRDLSRKAEVSLPLREMPFGKVFGVRDADGRPRYLVEPAAHRPSRPVR